MKILDKKSLQNKINSYNNLSIKSVLVDKKISKNCLDHNTKNKRDQIKLISKNLDCDPSQTKRTSDYIKVKKVSDNGPITYLSNHLKLNKAIENNFNTTKNDKGYNSAFLRYNYRSKLSNNNRNSQTLRLTNGNNNFPDYLKGINYKHTSLVSLECSNRESVEKNKFSIINPINNKIKENNLRSSMEICNRISLKNTNDISVNDKYKVYFGSILLKDKQKDRKNHNILNKNQDISKKKREITLNKDNKMKNQTDIIFKQNAEKFKKTHKIINIIGPNFGRPIITEDCYDEPLDVECNLKDITEENQLKIKEFTKIETYSKKSMSQANLLKHDRLNHLKMNKNLSSINIKKLLEVNLKNKSKKQIINKNRSCNYLGSNEFTSVPFRYNLKTSSTVADLEINEEFEESEGEEIKKLVKKLDFEKISIKDDEIFSSIKYKKANSSKNFNNFFNFLFCSNNEINSKKEKSLSTIDTSTKKKKEITQNIL